MAGNLKYGAVLFWKAFKFEDGGSSDKLLVVLGARQGKNFLACLTTSQPHSRKANPGCHAEEGYFFIPAGVAGFTKPTWIELNRPQEASSAEVLKACLAGDMHVITNLPQQLANEIRNCLARSPDLTPFIRLAFWVDDVCAGA